MSTPDRNPSGARPALFRCLLCFLGMVAAGCAEDVTFVTGTSEPFELYGYLDPTADTQKVRVFPIEEQLRPNLGEPPDAVFASTDLETGETIRWRDSLVAYADGTYGYLFWAAFRPAPGRTYRVEAERSDGAASSATVRVVEPPELLAPVFGGGGQVTLPILFQGTHTRGRSISVDYTFEYGKCGGEVATFSFPQEAVSVGAGERVDIPLGEDRREIRRVLEEFDRWNVSVGVVVQRITLRAMVTDERWKPPGGAFDPEVLIDPNAMTNVENGFGFVGSGYNIAPHVFHSPFFYGPDAPKTVISVEALETAGFQMELPPGNVGCVGAWPPAA